MDLEPKLQEWVSSGLISAEQADAIRAAEGGGGSAARRGRVSLAGEALAYVGGALVFGAFFVGFGGVWDDLGIAARISILVLATALLVASGMVLRRNEEPALERLNGFLWFMASGTFAGLAFLCTDEYWPSRYEDQGVALIGAASALASYPLWHLRRKALQQIAVFGGLMTAIIALAVIDGETAAGLYIAALGGVWLLGSQVDRILPRRTAEALGAIGMLMGMQTIGFDAGGWMFIRMIVAAGILGLGIVRDRNILLGLGAAGLFAFVPQFITEQFGASIGAAGSIAVAGLLILGAAVFIGRTRRAD